MSNNAEVELKLPVIPDIELSATKTAEVISKHMNLSEEKTGEISMAIIESCINAFEHSKTKEIYIHFIVSAEKLTIKVRDKGIGFDKSKVESAETNKKSNEISQDQDKNIEFGSLSLSEEDALKAQIFGCWSIPLGLPYNENLLVRIKLQLKPDGSIIDSEILDHARMNKPGQGFYKVLAESALRAVKLCQPLRVPSTGYERWKELQLNFDAREMLEG